MLENVTEIQEQKKLAYSVNEIAEMLPLSKAFIRGEIRRKNLSATKFGRRVLIMKDELIAYLEKGSKGRSKN
jgi:excisionase family DNA binding protein